jgi:hypothetical protein
VNVTGHRLLAVSGRNKPEKHGGLNELIDFGLNSRMVFIGLAHECPGNSTNAPPGEAAVDGGVVG